MKGRIALALVVSFAGGLLLTAGLGGALGAFDRGPTELDLSDAQSRARADAAAAAEVRWIDLAEAESQAGYARGREAAEWIWFDRLPNPDSWFAGVAAGRAKLEQLAEAAFVEGLAEGEVQGRDEALGAVR